MQITASSLTGAFGSHPLYWAQRMLDEGRVHILASDAHSTRSRPPNLAKGREYAAKRVGDDEALQLVSTRPAGILADMSPTDLQLPDKSRWMLDENKYNNPPGKNSPGKRSSGKGSAGRSDSSGNSVHEPDSRRNGLRSLFGRVQQLFR